MGPLVKNTIRDEKNNITFHILTPEAMSEKETKCAIRQYLRMIPRKKWPKPNRTVEFFCPIGIFGVNFRR